MERFMRYLNCVARAAALDRSEAFGHAGLSGVQLSYILQTAYNPGLSQDELAARLFVHKSTVARQVAQLVKNGYVRREKDKADRRMRRIFPTEKTLSILPEINAYLDEWHAQMTEDFTEEERRNLLDYLKRIAVKSAEHLNEHNFAGLLGLAEEEK